MKEFHAGEGRCCVSFPVCQDNGIGARYRRRSLPEIPAWKQAAVAKRPHSVEQEDVKIACQLHVLKSIIEEDDVHPETLDSEHASGVSVRAYHHGQTAQMLRQEHGLIASDLRRDEALLPIRNNSGGPQLPSPIATTQHAYPEALLLQEAAN
jgi:hypothetical protein